MHCTRNDNVTIISSDTDFIQSISDNIALYNPVKKSFVNRPEYDYIIWKALRGDASDNIEGFKGIGDKRAKALLENGVKLKDFLQGTEGNLEKFRVNVNLIRFHKLNKEEQEEIEWFETNDLNPVGLKEEFTNMNFNSIIGKETTWNKYINTFNLGDN